MPADPVKHVVVLMPENHSFDQMLGSFRSVFPDVDGVDAALPIGNRDDQGLMYSQGETRGTSFAAAIRSTRRMQVVACRSLMLTQSTTALCPSSSVLP